MFNIFKKKHPYAAHIKVLTQARKLIEEGKEVFVCVALNRVCTPKWWEYLFWESKENKAVEEIKNMIHDAIYPHNIVEQWLRAEHGIILDMIGEMKQYRLAWIDYMLEGWKNKRDNA